MECPMITTGRNVLCLKYAPDNPRNFITTFVNFIGAELFSSTMRGDFKINSYTAIGQPAWIPPAWGWSFNYHEVGWMGACGDV